MGIEADGSYIVVISGEDNDASNNPSPRAGDLILPPHYEYGDDNLGDNTFSYEYNGSTYIMRYVTVSCADVIDFSRTDTCALISASANSQSINDALDSMIYLGLDAVLPQSGTIASALGISFANINLNYSVSLALLAVANWTRVYTQVYNENTGIWFNHSSVDYVEIIYKYTGSYVELGVGQQMIDKTITEYRYSEHYSDTQWRKSKAARGYYLGCQYNEFVGDVAIYKIGDEVSLNNLPDPIFYFHQYKAFYP